MTSLSQDHANVWRSHHLGRVVGHYGAIDAIGAAFCLRCVVSWYEGVGDTFVQWIPHPGFGEIGHGLDGRD